MIASCVAYYPLQTKDLQLFNDLFRRLSTTGCAGCGAVVSWGGIQVLQLCKSLHQRVEHSDGFVEIAVAKFEGANLDEMAKGGAVGVVLRLREQREIAVETAKGVGGGNRCESRGGTRAAIQKDDGSGVRLESCVNADFGGAHFDGKLAHGIGPGEAAGELGQDGGGGFAEVQIARIAQHDAFGGSAQDGRDLVGNERPTAAGARESQAGFPGTGCAAE